MCKWIGDDASSEFKHANLVKVRKLVVSLGLDYEEECWPTLHELVRSWSRSLDELEARRNNQQRGMKYDVVG